MKQWKIIKGEDCPECGDIAEALTEDGDENSFYEGDEARCFDQCSAKGHVSSNDGSAYVSWDES